MKKISTGCNELIILLDLYLEFIFIAVNGTQSIVICNQTVHASSLEIALKKSWDIFKKLSSKAYSKFSYPA